MRFENPEILTWLWGVIGVAYFLYWMTKRKKRLLQRFAAQELINEIVASYDFRRNIIINLLLIAVFALSVIALARPQWGFELREVKRTGLDIMIVIDTSRSMLTQDVKPNRLARTKLAVKDLLKKLKGDRIGLIAFAGKAYLVCPLTVDYNGFLMSLEDLDTKTIPQGGTNLSEAIEETFKAYQDVKNDFKAIIILTDGENLEGDPLALAAKAKEKGFKIYCIGIGTKEGELIHIRNAVGGLDYLKDKDGNVVKSRLNEKLLQEISLLTNGVYVRASGAQFGLDLIYDQELSKLKKYEIESKTERKYYERFQIPLGLAVFMFVVSTCMTTRKKEKNL